MSSSDSMRAKINQAYGGGPGKTAHQKENDLDQVVRDHAALVRKVARRYVRASGGAVDIDDLTSVGMMGLIDAHGRYDPAGGRSFEVYAEFRIRGAIVDEMRVDPMSQPMRRKARSLARHRDELAQSLGREPASEEIAEFMGMELGDYQSLVNEVQPQVFLGNDMIPDLSDDISTLPADRMVIQDALGAAIESLPERSQQVLALYYYEDLTLREVGTVLELTEARVCQIHKEAVNGMKAFMRRQDRA